MGTLQDNRVAHVGHRAGGETDERMRREIRAARDCGLQVLLKPHIWVGGGAWRAEISPEDWHTWFASYRNWILRYARMAQEEQVGILAVGTELRSSVAHETAWRELLTAIRTVYEGPIVYCANWDSIDQVGFWDAVDYIGVQFYPPLADTPDASEASMDARLAIHLERLGAFSEGQGRPVLLTEVGYKSTSDTAIRPYEWTERGHSQVDAAAQERAYRVLFRGLQARDWLRGVYLWKWFTNPATEEEGPRGFSPRGKPAEAVIQHAFGAR